MKPGDPAGLVVSRRTEPWQGNGFLTRTLWTARYRGRVIGSWEATTLSACWVLAGDDERHVLPVGLRDWRKAVVAEAQERERTEPAV